MTNRSADILPANQSISGVAEQLTSIPLQFPARRRWVAAMIFAGALLALLMVSVAALFTRGVGIWGINIPVNWAFAIHNYVWWLGIGHAGTLISAFLLLTGSEWRNYGSELVLSILAYSLSASPAKYWNTLAHTPLTAQRLNRVWTAFQGPKRSGQSRQGIPAR